MGHEEAAEAEVVELHAFFTAWYNGRLERSEGEFGRLAKVLAEEFQIITPEAGVADRQSVLDIVEGSWGRYAVEEEEGVVPFVIEIRNFLARPMRTGADDLVLATYEEWPTVVGAGGGDEMQGRLSSVLLRVCERCPNGLEWVHLHECWLPVVGGSGSVSVEGVSRSSL